jgi:hypothetical protein
MVMGVTYRHASTGVDSSLACSALGRYGTATNSSALSASLLRGTILALASPTAPRQPVKSRAHHGRSVSISLQLEHACGARAPIKTYARHAVSDRHPPVVAVLLFRHRHLGGAHQVRLQHRQALALPRLSLSVGGRLRLPSGREPPGLAQPIGVRGGRARKCLPSSLESPHVHLLGGASSPPARSYEGNEERAAAGKLLQPCSPKTRERGARR